MPGNIFKTLAYSERWHIQYLGHIQNIYDETKKTTKQKQNKKQNKKAKKKQKKTTNSFSYYSKKSIFHSLGKHFVVSFLDNGLNWVNVKQKLFRQM